MTAQPPGTPARARSTTLSLYLTIGALIAAAILGGYFIIAGDQSGIAGRAWLTLMLVALFAGAVILDANLANSPNRWYLASSTVTNTVIVAIGLLKLWNGWGQPADTISVSVWTQQIWLLIIIIVLLRLALLITQFYVVRFVRPATKPLLQFTHMSTLFLVWATALVLVAPSAFPQPYWPSWWWRISAATALVAVVTLVIPVIIRAFEPKAPKPDIPPAAPYGAMPYAVAPYGTAQQATAPGNYAGPPIPAPPGYYPLPTPVVKTAPQVPSAPQESKPSIPAAAPPEPQP